MKFWRVTILMAMLLAAVSFVVAQQKSNEAVPKYDPTTEAVYKGTVDEVRDRQCPVSGGMGAHVILKVADNKTIEVHLATSKFVKSYDLAFNKGDQVEVTGAKVNSKASIRSSRARSSAMAIRSCSATKKASRSGRRVEGHEGC